MKSWIACIGVVLVALLSGCSSQPDPVTSTPAFATEDEAFAAAEQTYRNYVDALNRVDLSDPATFEDVYRWTTGDASAADRTSLSRMHAAGLTVSGVTEASVVESIRDESGIDDIALAVCLNVADVQLFTSNGSNAVPPDREDMQSRRVILSPSTESATGFLITSFEPRTGEPTCAS